MGLPASVLHLRCPKCREGRLFSKTLTMLERCPVCGHRFERAPGFFVGAMYASYALAVPLCAILFVILQWLFPRWSMWGVIALVVVCLIPFVPLLFRYSRALWIHMMWRLDPELESRDRESR
jgi:uncharacterized protein (DUF983 family)